MDYLGNRLDISFGHAVDILNMQRNSHLSLLQQCMPRGYVHFEQGKAQNEHITSLFNAQNGHITNLFNAQNEQIINSLPTNTASISDILSFGNLGRVTLMFIIIAYGSAALTNPVILHSIITLPVVEPTLNAIGHTSLFV